MPEENDDKPLSARERGYLRETKFYKHCRHFIFEERVVPRYEATVQALEAERKERLTWAANELQRDNELITAALEKLVSLRTTLQKAREALVANMDSCGGCDGIASHRMQGMQNERYQDFAYCDKCMTLDHPCTENLARRDYTERYGHGKGLLALTVIDAALGEQSSG